VAFTVLCLDRHTGKILWEKVARKEVPHQGIQPSNTYASGSPVTDGEFLYVSFGSQGLYCFDLDGKLVWEKDLGKVSVTFGEGASPALAGNTLLVVQDNNRDSFIYAFDKKTGRELWKKKREEGSGWNTPYVLQHGGKTLVLVSGSAAVRAYDLESGEVIWQCAGLGSNPIPMLVADREAVYAMSGHRNPAALAIKLGGSGDLTGSPFVRWTTDRGTPYVPSPLLFDGLLFYCQRTSGVVTCLDAVSGKPHYEQQRLEGISGVYGSPIGVADRIYLPGQNGMVVVLAKSRELKILASNKLEDGFDASPAVVGDELFLRGRNNLYCVAAR
jgi:outer membrane protein assembly factor BamB